MMIQDLVARTIAYAVEGIAVALAAFWIPRKKPDLQEVAMIGLTAATSLAVLDVLAPKMGHHTRKGAGLGIGASMVGLQGLPGVPA